MDSRELTESMHPHEGWRPTPDNDNKPGRTQTKWLLLVIAILLAAIAWQFV